MTLSRSRLAYIRRTRRDVVASAVLRIEKIGVMPLPPPNATTSPSPVRRNSPDGTVASSTSPGATASLSQFDTAPPGTRFTVTWRASSTAGAEDIE